MKFSKLIPAVIAAGLVLSGCTVALPVEPAGDGPDSLCDGSIFSGNIAAELKVEATPLDEPRFPIGELLETDLAVTCTAHYVVEYVEAGETVEFDVLVSADGIEPTAAAIDLVATGEGWVKDDQVTIWRDPDDPTHYVQALETPRGVLVGVTDAG